MIVLVIAGLILLIVFLAVPALQRNARNTSRKSDASAVVGAFNEFIDNNNGVLPTLTLAQSTNTGGVLTLGATQPNVASTQAKVGYYNNGMGTANGDVDILSGAQTYTGGAAADYLLIDEQAQCGVASAQGTATPKYTAVAGSTKSFVAIYETENGSGTYQAVCTES